MGEDEKKPKSKLLARFKRWQITVGVIVIVIVVACIGGLAWHSTPGFCSAFCHEPMDPYVHSYTDRDSTALVVAHKNEGYSCLDCHEPQMSEQISELMIWSSNSFETDENGRLLPSAVHMDATASCLSCHNMYEVIARTENFAGNEGFNPHANHQVTGGYESYSCTTCHDMHGQRQVLSCTSCHALTLPEGWEAVHE